MKIKQTIRNIVLGGLLLVPVVVAILPSVANAAQCGDIQTSLIDCSNVSGNSGVQGTGLWSLLLTAINILTAGIGVVALGGLIYGAILYTSAGGNPEQVKKARTIFTNIVIGIVAYAAMWALLNFIIPGGVL